MLCVRNWREILLLGVFKPVCYVILCLLSSSCSSHGKIYIYINMFYSQRLVLPLLSFSSVASYAFLNFSTTIHLEEISLSGDVMQVLEMLNKVGSLDHLLLLELRINLTTGNIGLFIKPTRSYSKICSLFFYWTVLSLTRKNYTEQYHLMNSKIS